MISREEVALRILALAEEPPDKIISGGRLSELLKHSFSGFSTTQYGARNLRAFIREHLSGKLNEVGKVGMDILYGPPGAMPPQRPVPPVHTYPTLQSSQPSTKPIPVGNISHDIFRVFKSPNSPFELHANRDTGVINVVDAGSDLQNPWVRISPANADTLLQVARDFAAQLSDDSHRKALTHILDQSPHAWWQKVWPYVQDRGLSGQWLAFKNKHLLSKLEAELRDRGVMTSGISAAPLVPIQERPNPSSREDSVMEPHLDTNDLRDVILKVVGRLPLSELRSLKLPVGDVLDAIVRRQRL